MMVASLSEETSEILTLANTDVVLNEHVDTIQTSKAEAETMGAVAFFGDKYGDRVRVVRAGRHSLEFCGGTHVDRLGDIGQIQIVSESSIGANTRRIEGVSGLGAYRRSFEMEQTLDAVAALLKTSNEDVVPALERLFERQRDMEKSVASLRQAQLSQFARELHDASSRATSSSRVSMGIPVNSCAHSLKTSKAAVDGPWSWWERTVTRWRSRSRATEPWTQPRR